jgi:hypothetical protein
VIGFLFDEGVAFSSLKHFFQAFAWRSLGVYAKQRMMGFLCFVGRTARAVSLSALKALLKRHCGEGKEQSTAADLCHILCFSVNRICDNNFVIRIKKSSTMYMVELFLKELKIF